MNINKIKNKKLLDNIILINNYKNIGYITILISNIILYD